MNKILNEAKLSLKLINWKLLSVIFLTLFLPVIYQTVRMHFIGTMPNSYAYSIAANMQWINILFEVLHEAFILPLFFVLGKIFKNKDKHINKKIIGKIYLIMLIFVIFISLLFATANPLLKLMSPKTYSPENIKYIRFEFINKFFLILIKIGLTILVIQNKWKNILLLLFVQVTLNILLDIFIISNLQFSLKKGIMGIAWSNLATYLSLGILHIYIIVKNLKLKKHDLFKPILKFNWKESKQFIFSGSESFIRNAFFIFFVIKVINTMENPNHQETWWVTTTFIWNWLLLPIFALSQYVNRQSAMKKNETFKERFLGVFILVFITILIWFATIPAYKPFIKNILKNKNYELINKLILMSIGFYVVFAYNEIADKAFYGEGKSEYILIQSVITNIVVYIPFYLSINSITIELVAIMFGVSMVLDSIITLIMFLKINKIWVKKKNVSKI